MKPVLLILLFFISNIGLSQLVINEICVSPGSGDGSFIGSYNNISQGGTGRGEWVELFNNSCVAIDISGYILGTYNSSDGSGAAFIVPAGKIIPAKCFAIIHGDSKIAPTNGAIDIVAAYATTSSFCIDVYVNDRMWFSNAGGWMALYAKDGTPVDMIKWGSPNPIDLSGNPCVPASSALSSSFTLKSYASYGKGGSISTAPTNAKSFVRLPDGGNWSSTSLSENNSYGSRNRPLPTASISYTNACVGDADKSVTLTGTGTYTGGTYTATPSGLIINSTSGKITTASSTPGTYVIKYTLLGLTCPDYAVTTNFTIGPKPTVTISQDKTICKNEEASITFKVQSP